MYENHLMNFLRFSYNFYSFNSRAKRVYEKAGFIFDSIDKAVLEFEGNMIDSISMVLTRKNWEEMHNIVE